MRAQAIAEGETLSSEASALRSAMTDLDTRLRTLRHETEALREQRATLSARAAKLTSDLEHLEATCLNDLSVEASALREDDSIVRIEAEALTAEDEAARNLKQRLEAMGPVNMMALEEYTETAERHGFLETQRKDLLDSIENTQASIKEIDDVSRVKFDEAYKVINENFSQTFTKLFGGGQAFMRLTEADEEGSRTSSFSQAEKKPSPRSLSSSASSSSSPRPSACSTKSTLHSTRPTSAASPASSPTWPRPRSSSSSPTPSAPWSRPTSCTASPCRSPVSPRSLASPSAAAARVAKHAPRLSA
jgi:predicted  nucleic acid-binding Zn-ribbon protein